MDIHVSRLRFVCTMGSATRWIYRLVRSGMVSFSVIIIVLLVIDSSCWPFEWREWALLIPAYSVIVCFLTYFSYFALAIAGTPAFSDMSTITGKSRAYFPRIMFELRTGLGRLESSSSAHGQPKCLSCTCLSQCNTRAVWYSHWDGQSCDLWSSQVHYCSRACSQST